MVPRLALVLALVVFASGCRVRTRYDSAATTECNEKAYKEAREKQQHDPMAFKTICDGCCHDKGLSAVEPGSCACGDLGLDALLK